MLQTMLRTALLSCAFLALAPAAPAVAEVRALLVGVSDYHVLDADLRGPRNDVRLLAETLIARGTDPAAISVLTTPGAALPQGVGPAQDPTRQAILSALDALAAGAGPDDTVLFYFSGHGSQAPDQNGDEAGGYDEILLPSDAASWKGQIGAVENALVDDELQVKMQAILDTGAELVAILDACHSATGFRAAGGAGVARYIAPMTLGIPDTAEAPEGGHIAPPLTGRFAFLYSSQSDERSFEYPLGDREDPANWYGDFTRNLSAVLTEVPDLTWAQALAATADGLKQEQAAQTPDGEGIALASPVFGAGGAPDRIRVENGKLTAGLLSGLSAGATVQIYAAAAGGEPLGEATLSDLTATAAQLDGAPDLPATAYAQVTAPGLPPEVRIGLPHTAAPGAHDTALAALARFSTGDAIVGTEWTDSDYDLSIVLDGDAIAITGRDGVLDPDGPGSSPRIPVVSDDSTILNFIEQAVHTTRVRQTLALAEGRKSLALPGAGLSVTATRLAATADCGEPPDNPQPLTDGSPVADCDQVWLTLRNSSTTAQDVTVLYIDRAFGIEPIWPIGRQSNRIAFGESQEIGLQIANPEGLAGIEEIVVIAVPARDGAMRTDLTGLSGTGVSRKAGATSATESWITAAANPGTASRALALPGRPEPIKVTRLRVALTPAGQ